MSLYKCKKVVNKNVTYQTAVDELTGLIKERGDWLEKAS